MSKYFQSTKYGYNLFEFLKILENGCRIKRERIKTQEFNAMKVGSANNFSRHVVIRTHAFSSILYKSECFFSLIILNAVICSYIYSHFHFLESYFQYLLKLVKGTILLLVRVHAVYTFCVKNLFKKYIYKQLRM